MSRSRKQVTVTLATPTTPAYSATGATDKERQHLTPAEFGAQLKALGQEVKDIVKVARKVGALKSGAHMTIGGQAFGAKELNALVSAHNKTLKQLRKNYTARGQRKKRSLLTKEGVPRKAGEGLSQPVFLEAPLVNFLRGANFGGGISAADLEPVLQYGILSRGVLTPLLTAYMKANALRFEEDGKKFFRASPQMVANLGPYLSALETSDAAKSDAEMLDKNGRPRMRFNRNKFLYNRLQSIVNPGVRSKDTLGEDEKAYVVDAGIKAQLAAIQAKASAANNAL